MAPDNSVGRSAQPCPPPSLSLPLSISLSLSLSLPWPACERPWQALCSSLGSLRRPSPSQTHTLTIARTKIVQSMCARQERVNVAVDRLPVVTAKKALVVSLSPCLSQQCVRYPARAIYGTLHRVEFACARAVCASSECQSHLMVIAACDGE
jgi:hypothetical protein